MQYTDPYVRKLCKRPVFVSCSRAPEWRTQRRQHTVIEFSGTQQRASQSQQSVSTEGNRTLIGIYDAVLPSLEERKSEIRPHKLGANEG